MIINGLFTSESVSDGHPDKICDQISDAILDACLKQDPKSRVALEAAVKGMTVYLLGEITTKADINFSQVVRQTLRKIGHLGGRWGIDPEHVKVIENITQQSADISLGLAQQEEQMGAGDQGLVFGYACQETEVKMPMSIWLAHQLMRQHKKVREEEKNTPLGPDAKTQVTLRYENSKPVAVDTIIFSTQHMPGMSQETVRTIVIEKILSPVLDTFKEVNTSAAQVRINPTGRFEIGGPLADAGLTGRKIIVDTYGGAAHHGGGAFSGKDGSKIDRSAAYAARYIAKNIVSNNFATHAEVQISYAIGCCNPVAVFLNTFGTSEKREEDILNELYPGLKEMLTPFHIIKRFNLDQPIFTPTATFGHFGWAGYPWEKIETDSPIG